ncbi:hypothetical protein Dda_6408 [Drechslerella dactyloides]|uniref:F-box domain-containing protein n=1 Tax=Drechslerella dactyloides TaxID=74499 RepID=A0AAD6NIW7_DREDA|nr:hypothetical protein Dda_6408 [Drechslerella dactyloides]
MPSTNPSLLSLPAEILLMICSYLAIYPSCLDAVSLTCRELFLIAAQYRHRVMNIQSDANGINWKPFSASLLPEALRAKLHAPESITFRKYKLDPTKRRGYRPRNTIVDFQKTLNKHGNFSFENVQSLSFDRHNVFGGADKYHSKFDIIKQFPQIKKLVLPVTANRWDGFVLGFFNPLVLSNSARTPKLYSMMNLSNLEDFSFKICGQQSRWTRSYLIDTNIIWDLAHLNSSTLRHLRIRVVDWVVELRDRPMAAWSRYLKPATVWYQAFAFTCLAFREDQTEIKLSLKTFQLEMFPQLDRTINLNFLQLCTLETLSLVFCRGAHKLLSAVTTNLVNLRCLQIIEHEVDWHYLADALRKLPPLEGLYVSMMIHNGVSPDCLSKHQDTMKRLVLLSPGPPNWFAKETDYPVEISFKSWTALEELTFHCKYLPELEIPPSLKFLSLVQHSDLQPTVDKSRLAIFKYAVQQMFSLTKSELNLRAVIIHPKLPLPLDMRKSFHVFQTRMHHNEKETTISVELTTPADFYRRYPEASILREDGDPSSWINAFV